jgi:hypothetical protein
VSFLGAGVGYRREHREALLAAAPDEAPAVLEVMPDHCFAEPESIDELAERYPIVFHDVGLSLGTAGGLNLTAAARLRRIAELAARAKPVLFGEHLALTRSPSGIDLGHLAPLWLTHELLELLVARVGAVQDALGVPVVLENIAAPFEVPGGDLTEPELFARLVERTGCGLLLDLTNLLYTARNRGLDPAAMLRAYPLAAVMQVHLAGGVQGRDGWVDSHSEPVEDESFALLAELRRAAPAVRAIIVERDDKLGSLDELVAEAARAERIWKEPA